MFALGIWDQWLHGDTLKPDSGPSPGCLVGLGAERLGPWKDFGQEEACSAPPLNHSEAGNVSEPEL